MAYFSFCGGIVRKIETLRFALLEQGVDSGERVIQRRLGIGSVSEKSLSAELSILSSFQALLGAKEQQGGKGKEVPLSMPSLRKLSFPER